MIGGGQAAVGLLGRMLARADEFRRAPRVVVYEPDNLGHGVAFGADLESALINLPAGRMSMDPGDPDQFARWLDAAGDAYVPRQVFGEYLVDEFWRAVGQARALGWTVDVVPETVAALGKGSANELLVRTPAGVRSFGQVVLGVGSGTTADPYRLSGASGYVVDPYPLAATLPGIAPRSHVLVIGTGLTAIDVVLGLLHLGHDGRITLASRTGILPGPRPQIMPLDPKHLTIDAVRRFESLGLGDVWELLKLELASAGFDADTEISWLLSSASATERLRYQLDRLDAAPIQSIFENLETPVPPMIRAALSADEMLKVAFDYKPYLKSIQCPMPPVSARKLLAVMDSGQLVVAPGITALRHRNGRFEAVARESVPAAEVVIDATRLSPRRTKGRARGLLDSLSAERLASWNSFDGLIVDPRTGRVVAAAPYRLFAYGEITAGELYYASSLPAVVRGANVVAAELVRHDNEVGS
ncbi:FAD/NAD(P)-binding protein [Kribbella albertanoniae]